MNEICWRREKILKHVTYKIRNSIVASPWTTDECARRTTTCDEHCTTALFIDQRETQGKKQEIVYSCEDILFDTFLLFTRFLRSSIVNIVREKKVAYISCCIAFEMNSCEYARTTISDEHSTTPLFVKSEEQEQEMLQ